MVYFGGNYRRLKQKTTTHAEYTSTRWDLDRVLNYSFLVCIAPLAPTGTLQAITGHRSFSYVVGKGEVREGVFSWL